MFRGTGESSTAGAGSVSELLALACLEALASFLSAALLSSCFFESFFFAAGLSVREGFEVVEGFLEALGFV